MFINRFIIGLMRLVGGVMFFGGMGMLAYAVIGGYYHYSPLLHAIAWGFAGWILFFVGMDVLEKYKPTEQAIAPQPPVPVVQPYSPYTNAGDATVADAMRNFGGSHPGGFDHQNSHD